jgi:hypothetical protein
MRTPLEWLNAPVATPRKLKAKIMTVQNSTQNRGKILNVMGITGSARPCKILTCGGTVRAMIYKYENGHCLLWCCNRCHQEHEAGQTEALTREPSSQEEILQ